MLTQVEWRWKQSFPLSPVMGQETAEKLGLPACLGVCIIGWWAGESCGERLTLLKRLPHGWAARYYDDCEGEGCWVVVDQVTWERFLERSRKIVASEYREAGLIFDPPGFNPFSDL